MQRRALAFSALLLVALAIVLPANAGKPTASSSATITDEGNCKFTVTYAWSGFSGTGLDAEVAIGFKGEYGADFFFAWTHVTGQSGSEGFVSRTFTLTGDAAARQFFGRGNLFKVSKDSSLTAVRDASAKSVYLDAQTCGLTAGIA